MKKGKPFSSLSYCKREQAEKQDIKYKARPLARCIHVS